MRVAKIILLSGILLQALKAFSTPGGDIPLTSVWVNIKPVFGNQPLLLETQNYVNQNGDTLQIDRFRFYLSGFELIYADGSVYKEKESYHLVDPSELSSLMINLSEVPRGEISSIRFNIGVDSIKSVSGAFGGDLDPANGMYWAWNSGYIHAKLEGRSKKCNTHGNAFEFHVGGFSGDENAIRKVELKVNPAMAGQLSQTIIITADAMKWFEGISLAKENSIVTPGSKAVKLADTYSGMFKIEGQ
ncbi:MAG TPA: MbnP family protein [Flavobacteriales bacterium]|nr:MbnP family protein [Flavobacteriales bacterium]